ncbi:hypothetical protein [Legionella micdadei]|uniref:Uncharacterized protein n=1 Tax=Legionella micdadei TaxID=451 RepID=A0A098GEN9_LEGMI|nr:hypothetical protein [Legionella micdadei]KTD27568.1 hypothetical protein Lmic_1888 [Legionella micdadei]CEG60943.1 protein of unknown function [Legionella micdadei]SCY69302.1 hypothetical protein SAMN02982997_02514 [Legionella micdadei]
MEIKITNKIQQQVQHVLREYKENELEDELISLVLQWCSEALIMGSTHSEKIDSAIQVNDIVQLDPEKTRNKMFAGCFMVVSEIKSWGVQGYVQALGENGKQGGQAYYRAKYEEIVKVGKAEWVVNNF